MRYYISNYDIKGKIVKATWETLWEWIKGRHDICLDLEGTGLDPYSSEITMLQLGDHETQFAVDLREDHGRHVEDLLSYIKDSNMKVIGQNLKFDWKMLCHHYNVRFRNVYDTMTAELILECGRQTRGFSLEKLTAKYLDFKYSKTNQLQLFSNNSNITTLTKGTAKEFLTWGDKPFTLSQFYYGLKDVEFTYKIYQQQILRLAADDLTKCASLEMQFMCVLGEMELNGFHVDKEKWTAQYSRNSRLLDIYRQRLLWYIHRCNLPEFKVFQLTLFDEKIEDLVSINLASSKQVIELCRALGIPTEVLDKKKSKEYETDVFKDSVEERHLKKYAKEYEIIPLYLKYRRYLKAVTTYGERFLRDHVNKSTGRIHSSFWPVLDTGRIASRAPNLQNIPSQDRFKGFRPCFTSPPGTRLIVTDYSNQEGRTLADLAGELNMISFFNTGDGDLHSHTARLMFKVPVSKTQNPSLRQLAKILNFGIAYGMSAYKLANDFNVSLKEAQEFIDKFYESYPQLKEYFEKKTQFTLTHGYVLIDDITRRRSYGGKVYDDYIHSKSVIDSYQNWRDVPKRLWSKHFTAKGTLQRMSQNYPIQGTSASMTKLAAVMLWGKIIGHNLQAKIKIVNIIHDEVVLEVSIEYLELAKEWVKHCMENAGKVFVRRIVMEALPTITDSWEHE